MGLNLQFTRVVGLGLAIGLVFFAMGQIMTTEAAAMPHPGTGEMRSALKFLQDLDNYYAQIARPRYVRNYNFVDHL
jgi:hypothetical protein